MKKSTSVLIGLVIIVVIALGAYAIFHNGNPYSNKNTNSSNSYGSSTQNTPSTKTPSTPTSSSAILQTKTDSSGQYLVNASGYPLYTYGGDTTGVSNCSGSCIAAWPIYAAGSTTSLPANVTVIKRSDGSSQYAYKGLPLYTFTGDTAGQAPTGNNVSNFHIAKP